ncbi:Signal transduction histidine kinase [Amycolatopsis xylanica]|uniref:histidine kinase n=1 Tax=Amycolatopsis xylanica TaxID=589385 RepID=A0A1H3IJF7_9PSEU|nr:nitrate- and nitrite sensing domain-containing protein [Amycolatopsis xylanica]SDY27802.1 Signal transduction histidine kinase [Amycolatopsis xylanica]
MPVGKLLGRQPRKPRKMADWRAVLRWRDWSLPVKLSAVTLVPILIALVLGVTTIANQVGKSDSYQRIDRLVALNSAIRTLTDGLQRERTQTAAVLTAGNGVSPELTATRGEVDRLVVPFTLAAGKAATLDPGIGGIKNEAGVQVARLADVREQGGAGKLSPVQSIGEYTLIIGSLLNLDTALTARISDDAIGGTPSAQHDLQVAKEQVSLIQGLVDYGIARGTLAPTELNQVRSAQVRFVDNIDDFRAAASQEQRQDYDSTVAGGGSDTRDTLIKTALGESGVPPEQAFRKIPAQSWNESSAAILGRLGEVSQRLGDQTAVASAALVESSSSGAGLLAVLLFGALVLAAAVVFVITRQLLRSLKILRNSALDVANTQLPEAVRNIQEGRPQNTEVEPVPVTANDEIGEVARAFDAVHHQAIHLAAEQAAMRTGYSSVFVNLSRRSQSLVQRQLQLIERLERDEEDADQLATLFQLDHLATRMRRNNENLMVLSGSESTRRSGQPVTTTDIVRGAVSEIEQYQRVVVQPPPTAKIVGYAAGDLTRLIAELLDNATAFSAPETKVTVAVRIADDRSLSIDILDKGIGMNEAEVTEANSRLTEAASVDLATSRRMGLFVVGRLASRHRIGVSLHGGKDIVGVRATVSVPPELVMTPYGGDLQHTGPIPASPQQHQQPGQALPQPSALPRRQRPANGTRPSPSLPEAGWPSAEDVAALNERPPSDMEISGTALFSPISSGDDQPRPTVPPQRPAEPPKPPKAPEPETVSESGQLPSGKELFVANGTALGEWWSQSAKQAAPAEPPKQAKPGTSETTPIFDEMLSAWFREPKPPQAEKQAEGETPKEKTNWDLASDENWRKVQAVTQTAPSTFTEAGLPRRQRGEKLMPGSAEHPEKPAAAAKNADLPVRDPADVRGRLSSFQQGVSRGRKQTSASAKPAEPSAPKAAEEKASPAPKAPEAPKQEKAALPPLPQRQAKPVPAAAPPAPEDASELTATAEWAFGSDDGWRTVQAVSQSAPSTFTPAGLPRRRRGEQLLPGSATAPAAPAGPRRERDAQDVRGRLSSFQQGIRRGRHRTAHPAEANPENLEGE